jgi:hypothetical protein
MDQLKAYIDAQRALGRDVPPILEELLELVVGLIQPQAQPAPAPAPSPAP